MSRDKRLSLSRTAKKTEDKDFLLNSFNLNDSISTNSPTRNTNLNSSPLNSYRDINRISSNDYYELSQSSQLSPNIFTMSQKALRIGIDVGYGSPQNDLSNGRSSTSTPVRQRSTHAYKIRLRNSPNFEIEKPPAPRKKTGFFKYCEKLEEFKKLDKNDNQRLEQTVIEDNINEDNISFKSDTSGILRDNVGILQANIKDFDLTNIDSDDKNTNIGTDHKIRNDDDQLQTIQNRKLSPTRNDSIDEIIGSVDIDDIIRQSQQKTSEYATSSSGFLEEILHMGFSSDSDSANFEIHSPRKRRCISEESLTSLSDQDILEFDFNDTFDSDLPSVSTSANRSFGRHQSMPVDIQTKVTFSSSVKHPQITECSTEFSKNVSSIHQKAEKNPQHFDSPKSLEKSIKRQKSMPVASSRLKSTELNAGNSIAPLSQAMKEMIERNRLKAIERRKKCISQKHGNLK